MSDASSLPPPQRGSRRRPPFLDSASRSRPSILRQRAEVLNTIRDGLPYSRRLSAHTSCVNALTLSSEDGRFLASGGDDLDINLWDFHQDDIKMPAHTCVGPRANIFSLAFSATNKYLVSGGADKTILRYDVSYLSSGAIPSTHSNPDHTSRAHDASIRSLSFHPANDDLFYSASEDGQLILHDCRTPRPRSILQFDSELADVQSHPRLDHLIVIAGLRGRVSLRDTRMIFGAHNTDPSISGVLEAYTTGLSKKTRSSVVAPETSSVCFNRDGTLLAVTIDHYLPTLYSLLDPSPLATFSGRNRPDGSAVPPGERTYTNSCTMKHGSFGKLGPADVEYYSTGSDDFRAYLWKIPSIPELIERRPEINAEEWQQGDWSGTIGFTSNREHSRLVPVEICTPAFRLTGHRSIVNSTMIHPQFPHVITAGIERDIILHSPTSSSPCTRNLGTTPTEVRDVLGAIVLEEDEEDEHTDSEYSTIRLFDNVLRFEGSVDIFAEGGGRSLSEETGNEQSEDAWEEGDRNSGDNSDEGHAD